MIEQIGDKKERIKIILMISLILFILVIGIYLLKNKNVNDSSLKSDFFKNDLIARDIIEGKDFLLDEKNSFLNKDRSINALSFEFKLTSAFKQLGYAGIYLTSPKYGLNKFQREYNFEELDTISREVFLKLDQEIYLGELEDDKIASKYIPYFKFMNGPENEPSKEHLSRLYYNLFISFPESMNASFLSNLKEDNSDFCSSILTIDEFMNFMVAIDGTKYFGRFLDSSLKNISNKEVLEMLENKNFNFNFCADIYYSRLRTNRDAGCENPSSIVFNGAIGSDVTYSDTLAHEFGHLVGMYLINLNGKNANINHHFSRISFNKEASSDSEFISRYAKTNNLEDFAESFMGYISNGKVFRMRAKSNEYLQQKYDFLKDNVFHGQEYDTGSIESFNLWESKNKGLPPSANYYIQDDPNWKWNYKYPILNN